MSSKPNKSLHALWERRLRSFGLGSIEHGHRISRQVFSVHNSNARSQSFYSSVETAIAEAKLPEHKRQAVQLYARGYTLSQIRNMLSASHRMPKTRSGMHKLIQNVVRSFPELSSSEAAFRKLKKASRD